MHTDLWNIRKEKKNGNKQKLPTKNYMLSLTFPSFCLNTTDIDINPLCFMANSSSLNHNWVKHLDLWDIFSILFNCFTEYTELSNCKMLSWEKSRKCIKLNSILITIFIKFNWTLLHFSSYTVNLVPLSLETFFFPINHFSFLFFLFQYVVTNKRKTFSEKKYLNVHRAHKEKEILCCCNVTNNTTMEWNNNDKITWMYHTMYHDV